MGTRGLETFAPVFEDDLAGDAAGRAHDAAARMRSGTAHIKVVDRSAIVSPPRNWAEKEKLFEGEFALEDVALGQAEFALEVERREDLAADDNLFYVGGMLGDGVHDGVAEGFAMLIPSTLREFVGRVLHETGHDVLARRRDAGVGETGNDDVDVGLAGVTAVLGIVVGALHVLDAGGDGNCSAQMGALAGQAFEIGERVESEIHFAGGAAEFVAADAFEEVIREFIGREKFLEGEMRVDAGGNYAGGNFFAGFESNAGSATVLYEDFVDGGLCADFHTEFAGGCGDSVADGTGAAAAESPGTEGAVDFAHVVMKENVSRAGGADAEEGPDDAGSGHGGFEDVGLEPLVEEIGGTHGHELDEGVALVGREIAKTLAEEVEALEVTGMQGGRIGRDHGEDGLHEAAHRGHHLGEFVVGFGVEAGVAANFALRAGVVIHAPEVVAVVHGSEGAVEGEYFEAVAREIEFANDFWAQERDDVGTFGEEEAGDDFVSDGGAA